MTTYTTITFYAAIAIAIIGWIVVLTSPTRRANVLDALRRHPTDAEEHGGEASIIEARETVYYEISTPAYAATPEPTRQPQTLPAAAQHP
jgi:hypothetical protein